MRIEPDGEQHPAAAKAAEDDHTEPDPPDDDRGEPDPPAEAEPKPRRRRGLLLPGSRCSSS
ncbi:hypothetical protein ACFSVJ_18945 [Prauserella oleivorans]